MKHIALPSSKSISNRLLILQQTVGYFPIHNLSAADDTLIMQSCIRKVLSSQGKATLYADNCGTACRFLTAWLAATPGEWVLQGSPRMCSRPIAPLVEALQSMGADIAYMDKQGCLPLYICGHALRACTCNVDVSMSTQFATAILLILPLMRQPVQVSIQHADTSWQYISQTLMLMQQLGLNVHLEHNVVYYIPTPLAPLPEITVECDWSSAAFWYEYVALQPAGTTLLLQHLQGSALQKDNAIASWMLNTGVSTTYTPQGVVLLKTAHTHPATLTLHGADNLDIVPPMLAACAALQIPACITGTHNLQYKESNRITALQQALRFLAHIDYKQGSMQLQPLPQPQPAPPLFNVCGDHRIAMALAMLPQVTCPSMLDDVECVNKSYPLFWTQWHNICIQK